MRYFGRVARCWFAFVLGVTLSAGGAWDALAAPPEVDRLAEQLAAPRFKDREAAAKKLNAIGAPALPALRWAMQGGDAEMRGRASELAAAIEARSTSSAVFAPTIVHLKAHGDPLADVLRDLSQQSKIRLFLAREPVHLGRRPVTIDTGETSFWEALDALCRQAKVHLRPEFEEAFVPDALKVARAGGYQLVVLDDGLPAGCPTAYLGGVRLQLLPRPTQSGKPHGEGGQWILEALCEPKCRWLRPLALLWDEALGSQGRRLTAVPTVNEPGKDAVMVNLPGIKFAGIDYVMSEVSLRNVRRQEIPLKWQLPLGAQPAVLRGRLKGVAQVHGIAVQTNDLKRAGSNPIAGKEGFRLTIQGCHQGAGGRVQMEVMVNSPALPATEEESGMEIAIGGGAGPRMIGPPRGEATIYDDFHVWDHKGRPYQIAHGETTVNEGGSVVVCRLMLTPPAKDSVPMKLELHASYPTGVERPFVFRDIRSP